MKTIYLSNTLLFTLGTLVTLAAGVQQQQSQNSQQQQQNTQKLSSLRQLPFNQTSQSGLVDESPPNTNSAIAKSQLQTSPAIQPQQQQQPKAKSNHRLVNKIKANARRHSRRSRLRDRNRLQKAAALVGAVDPHAASTLTALESIVEEVARVGQQLPATTALIAGSVASGKPLSAAAVVASSAPSATAAPLAAPQVAASATGSQSTAAINQQPQIESTTALSRVPSYNSKAFFLSSMLSKIMNVLNVTEFALEMRDGISSRASCMACNAVVGLFLSPLYSKEVFSAAIRTVCTSFKIQSARVCAGLVESFQDDFEYIRKNTKLSRDEVCAVVFGVDCARRQTYNLFWTVPIPDAKIEPQTGPSSPAAPGGSTNAAGTHLTLPMNEHVLTNMDDAPDLFEYRKSSVSSSTSTATTSNTTTLIPRSLKLESAAVKPQQAAPSIQVVDKVRQAPQYIFDNDESGPSSVPRAFVHITDIHIDPYYQTGSLNDCNEPLCCRATSGPVAVGDKRRQAGHWGDYGNCDTPLRTLRSALGQIRDQHPNAEYWIWTGDISPHDIWNISKAEASNHVRLVSREVREYSNGLPVFPVIGNHEAHPVNSFSPPEIKGKFSMSWLYDLLADEWSNWLPADALKTLRIGGFYKLQVRKGFRIIALNTNYCARLNPWSFYDPVDPAKQLKWLADELLEAELNQDKVHIIGHVPPDNRECTQAWLFNFINIVDRFRDTIVAQFYGHTHRDEWRIIYSMKREDEPIGIQFIGPSITPFTENNPAYRVYHQDRAGNLIDSETYYFNLTEANESPHVEPKWRFSYRAQTHLNMTKGLHPTEWHNYLQRLHEDDDLFDGFFKNYYRSSDVKSGQVCKAKCKFQMLGDLRLSHPYKTKPKPFLANRKTSNHHRDRHHHHHHDHGHHHKRLRHL